ncbi:MAG TPA: sulfurtransferase-like selenium metabolism protein YedF [Bacillota bacterium]|nr:sulfurtransferase-like selenium metabolism protein YedF [Bacillota bacterium]
MSAKVVDCRGLACPQPVIETKKAIESGGERNILVIVDNPAARDNVTRFAGNAGYNVGVEEKEDCYYLSLTAPAGGEPAAEAEKSVTACSETDGTVYFVITNALGQGSPDLGEVLMKSFINTLAEQGQPRAMLFLNTGVYLTVEGSPVLDKLKELAGRGTEMLVCGTCLNYYKVMDKLAVGVVSNMYEIHSRLTGPYRVVTVG